MVHGGKWHACSYNTYATQQSVAANEPDNFSISQGLANTKIVLLAAYQLRNIKHGIYLFNILWRDRGCPLLAFRSTETVLSVFCKRLFTKLTVTYHFF